MCHVIDEETFEDAIFEPLTLKLESRFGMEGQSSLYQSRMRVRRREKGESLQDLYHDKSRMAGLAFPGKSSIHRELAETEAFIETITDGHLRMRIRDKEPKRSGARPSYSLTSRGEHSGKSNCGCSGNAEQK